MNMKSVSRGFKSLLPRRRIKLTGVSNSFHFWVRTSLVGKSECFRIVWTGFSSAGCVGFPALGCLHLYCAPSCSYFCLARKVPGAGSLTVLAVSLASRGSLGCCCHTHKWPRAAASQVEQVIHLAMARRINWPCRNKLTIPAAFFHPFLALFCNKRLCSQVRVLLKDAVCCVPKFPNFIDSRLWWKQISGWDDAHFCLSLPGKTGECRQGNAPTVRFHFEETFPFFPWTCDGNLREPLKLSLEEARGAVRVGDDFTQWGMALLYRIVPNEWLRS